MPKNRTPITPRNNIQRVEFFTACSSFASLFLKITLPDIVCVGADDDVTVYNLCGSCRHSNFIAWISSLRFQPFSLFARGQPAPPKAPLSINPFSVFKAKNSFVGPVQCRIAYPGFLLFGFFLFGLFFHAHHPLVESGTVLRDW